MHLARWTIALLLVIFAQAAVPVASAQEGTPTFSNRYDGRSLGPGRGAGLFVTVSNTTDTPIVVSGVTMTDLVAPESCPRHWFGDAGYNDRPRGENETTPPVPAYPLPSAWLDAPVTLEPGEAFELPMMELFMIEAAPNACQRINLSPVNEVAWEFVVVQTYGTVSGTITDVDTGLPITNAQVAVTGTTDSGLVSEVVPVDENGTYTSPHSYLTETDVTAEVTGNGYLGNSSTISVTEGNNIIDLTMAAAPIPSHVVTGTVVDSESDAPVGNASIVLTGTDGDGNPASETVSSNASGQFTSTIQFRAGTPVTIDVTAEGYQSAQAYLEAVSDEQNFVAISLTQVAIEDNPTATPSPTATASPDVTPDPESTPDQTAPVVPAPAETPTITPAAETAIPTQQAVTTLPATGTGGTNSMGLMFGGLLAVAFVAAFFCRSAWSGRRAVGR